MADYNSSICCIFNIGTHYRNPNIFKNVFGASLRFYFGDRLLTPIKKMDYTQLNHFAQNCITNIYFLSFIGNLNLSG